MGDEKKNESEAILWGITKETSSTAMYEYYCES